MTEKKGGSMMRDPEKEYENAMDVMMEMKARDEDTTVEDMTNNEAAKWIQIYIDEWNEDLNQMKGFGMRLDENGKKMMKAIEMGRDALTRTENRTARKRDKDMTSEEAADVLRNAAWLGTNAERERIEKAVEMAIAALTAQPETHEERTETHGVCLDVIDRQATLDWLKNEWNGMITSLFDGIKALPSAQPEIIRCHQCGFWDRDTLQHNFNDFRDWNEAECLVLAERDGYHEINRYTEADDFCSRAERRSDEAYYRKE